MPKINRNDPCPCGSGKKYKNCHMRGDQLRTSRELSLRPEEGALLSVLYQFAQLPRYAAALAEALDFFWGGHYDLRAISDDDVVDLRRTLEWFIFDRRLPGGGRVVDQYLATEGARLNAEIRQIAAAWGRSAMGVFRLAAPPNDGRLPLYDPLQQRELTVFDPMLARTAQVGDVLVGRLYTLDDAQRLMMMATLLPAEYEAPLAAFMRHAYEIYGDEHPRAGWTDFLRENGHLVNAFLISPRAEALRVLIARGTRFHDPAVARDRLRERTTQLALIDRQAEADAEAPAERRTGSGLVLPYVDAPQAHEEEGAAPRPTILVPGRDF